MKKYLDPVAVSRLQNMKIRARLVVEGFSAGMHKSPLKGNSTDFADYRRYTKGDDLKHLDWKIYAKVGRHYIKEFEDFTALSTWIVLDTSESMAYAGATVRKVDYGCYLAAALMMLMENQQDNAGLVTFSDRIGVCLPPRRGKSHLDRMLTSLEEITPGDESRIADCLTDLGEKLKRRGLVVVISDLMDDPDKVLEALKQLRSRKNEVIVFHVLDHDELTFPFYQLMEFEDLETGARLKIDCEAVRRSYKTRLESYLAKFEEECPRAGIDYVRADTSHTFHEVLTRYLQRRNQVAR